MILQQAIKPFGLRLPLELKSWLDSRAKHNGRSVNSEIVQMVKAAKQSEQSERV